MLSSPQVSRGAEFLYLTRGLTKKIRVDKTELVVTWGNLELAFANREELGIFISALKYVDFVEDGNNADQGAPTSAGTKASEDGAAVEPSAGHEKKKPSTFPWSKWTTLLLGALPPLRYV